MKLHEKKISELEYGGTLQIAVGKEDLDKLREIRRLLEELGVTFDSGMGGTCGKDLRDEKLFISDWELDWSLKGARFNPHYTIWKLKEWAISVVKDRIEMFKAITDSENQTFNEEKDWREKFDVDALSIFLIERFEITKEELK